TNDALIAWEGQPHVSDPSVENTDTYKKAATDLARPAYSPLHFFDTGGIVDSDPYQKEPLWQEYFLMMTLGHVKELGYHSGPLLTWLGYLLTSQFNQMPPNGTYDIKLLSAYFSPMRKDTVFFTDWEQVQQAMGPDRVKTTDAAFNASDDYAVEGEGAASMLTNDPGGMTAWNWFLANVHHTPGSNNFISQEPSWSLLPRSSSDIPLPPPVFTPIPTVPVIPATTTPTTTPPVNPPATTTPSVTSAPLKNISITGDFTQTTTCATAAAKSPCTISLVFKPTAAGQRAGTLAFTDAVTAKA